MVYNYLSSSVVVTFLCQYTEVLIRQTPPSHLTPGLHGTLHRAPRAFCLNPCEVSPLLPPHAGAASFNGLAFLLSLLAHEKVSGHTESYQQGHYLVCVTSHPVSDTARDVEGTASRDAALGAGGLFSFFPGF